MKICCKLPNHTGYAYDYTCLNLFKSLEKILNCYKYDGSIENHTTHLVFLDYLSLKKRVHFKKLRRTISSCNILRLLTRKTTTNHNGFSKEILFKINSNTNEMIKFLKPVKDKGIKVVICVYDPARFPYLDPLIDYFDKIILFDQKFKNRFPIPTYISDYFLNEELFSKPPESYGNKVCYFGHLNDRDLPEGVVHIKSDSLKALYKNVQNFNGVYVFDIGNDEKGERGKMHHNKAKAIEVLMCGRNVYAMDRIKTKAYDKFILPANEYKNCPPVSFNQQEIFELNRKCIRDFINAMINC